MPIRLIQQALEAAWLVARAGLTATPPVQPPLALRPMMRFFKLPAASLVTVRAVLDSDPTFRARVLESVDPDAADRASWLWLARPDGWGEELGQIISQAEAVAEEARDGRAERSAQRRLESAEAAKAKSEQDAEAARRSLTERTAELARERSGRRAAEMDAEALREAYSAARADMTRARQDKELAEARAARADAARSAAEGRHDALVGENNRLRHEVQRLALALEAARTSEVEIRRNATERRSRAGLSVLDAARAAQMLGDALARAAVDLGTDLSPTAPPDGQQPARLPDRFTSRPLDRRRSGDRQEHRRPVPIPAGMFGDSVEAANHLVRAPSALVLVDGYNVSIATWPGSDLAEQRRRLTAALGELVARSGAAVHVVFDASAKEQMPAPPGEARRLVRVSFSTMGEDADEVLIDLVNQSDPSRPVVVVTDDRRVRAEVERRGANTLSVCTTAWRSR